MKTSFITIMLAAILPLIGCNHQAKGPVSQSTKTELDELSDQNKPLMWRCPAVSFQRRNPDGTYDSYGVCGIVVGSFTVLQNRGAIVPLGKLISSEDIAPKTFDSYPPSKTYESGPIKRVTYIKSHDASKTIVGYEVLFPECSADDFTLYIDDKDEDGALEALQYVFDTMKFASYCELG